MALVPISMVVKITIHTFMYVCICISWQFFFFSLRKAHIKRGGRKLAGTDVICFDPHHHNTITSTGKD